ncbi:MAG: HYR domain-containing protein [Flavobacteriales bacterium]|nr:HYR domain-containing protein [Flavobacteriales bacterium]
MGQNGLVHVVGRFKDDLTMGTRSITSTSGKVQPFVASFRPTGSGASLEDLISSNDALANAITADDQGNFILAGYYANIGMQALADWAQQTERLFGEGVITRIGRRGYFFWTAPATMCSNADPLDLSTLLTPYQTGNAASVVSSSNVLSPPSILGGVLGNYAQFNTTNGYVTVDLGVSVPVGGIISLLWHSNGGAATATTLVGTANPPTVAQSSSTTSSTTDVYTSIVLTSAARYLRVTRPAGSVTFHVDGIYYEYGNDLGGTWSGTGVSGSTFNPSGISGPVSITYTIGTPPCTTSTSNSITIEAAPEGGSITSSVSGMLCPGNNAGTLTLSGYLGTIVEWQASADNFASFTVLANTLATYSFNNLTQTTSYRARVSNNCGTVLSASYTVQVGDNTAPVITTCPLPRTIYVGANCKAPIPDLLPSAVGADNCSATLTWTQFPVALSLVNKGIHVVVVTATDGAGNATTCNVTITARDTTPPVISGCPGNVTLSADPGKCSAVYNFIAPTATDNCGMVLSAITVIAIADVDGLAISVLNAPNEYPVGVTTRTFTFADASGTPVRARSISPRSTTSGPRSCPVRGHHGASIARLCGTAVNYTIPVFADNCFVLVERTQGAASGDFFPVGTTPVKHLATDSAGNSVSCTFNVIVQDGEAPVLTGCPSNFIVQAPLAGTGAVATWTPPIASDNCGAATITQTVGQVPGSFLTLGAHVITYTATAPNGVTSTCTFTITVISNDAPTITCPANQVLYSTPFDCAQVFSYGIPPVGDDMALPAGQPVQIDGTGHTSGAPFPLGSTVQTWRVTDSNSNSTTCSFTVQVIDTIMPSFPSCPTNVTISAEPGECGAHYVRCFRPRRTTALV